MKATDLNGKYVPIASLDDLKAFEGKDVTICRMIDRKIGMATVHVEHMIASSGNFGDFYPGCHGGWNYDLEKEAFSYRSSQGLAEALQKALIARGAKSVKIETTDYDWCEYTSLNAFQNAA